MTEPPAAPPPSSPPPGGTLYGLQAARAVAAGLVMMQHALHEAARIYGRTEGASFPWQVGVDLFFVISGFIIVYTSAKLFGAPGGPGRFLERRLLRVVPLYWLFTSLLLPVTLFAGQLLHTARFVPLQVVCSYLFFPGYTRPDGSISPVLATGWTLNYEMFFYLAFTPLIALSRARAVAAVAVGFGALALLGSVVDLHLAPLRFWARPIILDFVAGALFAHAYLGGWRLPRAATWALGAAAMALLAAQPLLDLHWPRLWSTGVPAVLLFCPFALARGEARREAWPAPVLALGDASYSLYLSHPFSLFAVALGWKALRLHDRLPEPAYTATALACALLGGWLTYAWIERPLMRLLRRDRAGARGAPPADPHAAAASA